MSRSPCTRAARKGLHQRILIYICKICQKSSAGADAPESVERAELNFLRDEVQEGRWKVEGLEDEKVAMQAKLARIGKLSALACFV